MGITQVALAEKTGVTRAAVAVWEADKSKPRIHILQEIARILEVDIRELLRGGDIPEDHGTDPDSGPAQDDGPNTYGQLDVAVIFGRLRTLARKELGIDLNDAQILQWLVKLAQIETKLDR